MKQKLFMLPFIAAVAIAAVVGKKTFGSHENESGTLLMQNVEALADGEESVTIPCLSSIIKCRFNIKDADGNLGVMVVDDAIRSSVK